MTVRIAPKCHHCEKPMSQTSTKAGTGIPQYQCTNFGVCDNRQLYYKNGTPV